MVDPTAPPAVGSPHKADLRAAMRRARRALGDRDARSLRLWELVDSLPAVAEARRIMVFSTIVGEPEIGPFLERCHHRGALTMVPEDDVDPSWPDVVLVPGLAFTAAGGRLGQGGGWYDRFLASVDRSRCTIVGVAFAEQLVDTLPLEPHDVLMDLVVTDAGVVGGP
jgi:5-formyltetrahydrofolate cyclo-ligase